MSTLAEAQSDRMMGSTREVEDRTNAVCRFSCRRCHAEMFYRWFRALRMWPYHCQEPVNYNGTIQ